MYCASQLARAAVGLVRVQARLTGIYQHSGVDVRPRVLRRAHSGMALMETAVTAPQARLLGRQFFMEAMKNEKEK